MADTINANALPESALLDTSILIPALRGKNVGKNDETARLFFDAMIAAKKRVLIAAPSLSELLRRAPKLMLPVGRRLEIVAFDQRAAHDLGTRFPPEILVKARDESKTILNYIKYDAMIVACAFRHRAAVLVTTDGPQTRLAEKVGMMVKTPKDYADKQITLDLFSASERPPE